MIYLISGLMFFFLYVITHIVCVRVKLVKFQLPALLSLSCLWLVVYVGSLVMTPGVYNWEEGARHGILDVRLALTSLVVYFLLCLCYVAECSGLEYESPSMQLMELVRGHGKGKMSYDELRQVLTNERLVLPRLEDLVSGGFVAFDGRRYVLLPRGAMIARIFAAYRRLLGRGLGG